MGTRSLRSAVTICGVAVLMLLAGCGGKATMSPASPVSNSTVQNYGISGTLAPPLNAAGATVTLSGAVNGVTTADSNGNFQFAGMIDGNYTITPIKAGITFSPSSQTISINGSSISLVNFSGAATPGSGGSGAPGPAQPNVPGGDNAPTPSALQSLIIEATGTSLPKGTREQFTAIGTFSNGSTQNLTGSATWSSSNTAAVTISTSGLATGTGIGSSNISAALNGVTSNIVALSVTAATLQSISITANSVSIAKGTTDQFTAIGTFSDASTQNLTASATWSSSNTAAATMSTNGLATGTGIGTSNISAAQSGVTSNIIALSVTAATLRSIAITANSVSIAKGTTDQLTAIGTFSDASTQNLTTSATWSSSNTAAAIVSSSGLATGEGIGTSNISATQSGVTSNIIALSVTAATLQSIVITANSVSIAKGATDQFTATGTFSDGSTQSLTASATWSSSNIAAATMSTNGLATGTGIGTSNISAAQNGVTSNIIALSVTPATLQSIAISAPSSALGVTANEQLTAVGTYSDGSTQTVTSSVTWSSSNPAAASVSASGVATGIAVGQTTISATQGSIKGSFALSVTASLSGTLSPSNTTSGAAITLSGAASATTTADANGNYSFTGLTNGTYTVTPGKTGFVFSPVNQQVVISGLNKIGVNFAVVGQLSVTPSSFSFGTVNLGTTSALQTGTLMATNGDVTLTTDTLSGAGFIFSGITFPLTIPSGQNASFNISFAPAATGSASGTLSLTSNASNTLPAIGLSGTGAGLSVSPSILNFGAVPDGTNSASQTGTLTAIGTNLTITAANVTGNFSVSGLPTLPFTIAAGQSQPYTVTFNPAAGSPGAATGKVSFSSSVNNVTESFSGTGAPNVLISWQASTTPNVTYKVYRCVTSATACVQSSPSNFTDIEAGSAALTYTDLSVSSAQIYYYAVTAVDANNDESNLSNVVSVLVP